MRGLLHVLPLLFGLGSGAATATVEYHLQAPDPVVLDASLRLAIRRASPYMRMRSPGTHQRQDRRMWRRCPWRRP